MTTTSEPRLGYWINDADNHFNEPPGLLRALHRPEVRRPVHPQRDRAGRPSRCSCSPGSRRSSTPDR